MSHFDQLARAFKQEWAVKPANAILDHCDLYNDGTRHWWVEDHHGGDTVIKWECRRFPGCDTLVITTKVELRGDLRGMGLGRFFQEFRHRAYRRAGFTGELATVRSDNGPQIALMAGVGEAIGEFRSDFGGTFKLIKVDLTRTPAPARVPDAPAVTPPAVRTPPRDPARPLRSATDAELHAQIRAAQEEASAADGFILPSEAELELRRRQREVVAARTPTVKYSHWK